LQPTCRHRDQLDEVVINLVSANKSPSAERAGTGIVSARSTEGACARAPDKTASSEINLGCSRLVGVLQITQQRVDALMIALYCGAWPVQLHNARQDL
jgi:hypothetical protein